MLFQWQLARDDFPWMCLNIGFLSIWQFVDCIFCSALAAAAADNDAIAPLALLFLPLLTTAGSLVHPALNLSALLLVLLSSSFTWQIRSPMSRRFKTWKSSSIIIVGFWRIFPWKTTWASFLNYRNWWQLGRDGFLGIFLNIRFLSIWRIMDYVSCGQRWRILKSWINVSRRF